MKGETARITVYAPCAHSSFNRVPSGPRVGVSVAASSVVALGSLVACSASPRGPVGTRLNDLDSGWRPRGVPRAIVVSQFNKR